MHIVGFIAGSLGVSAAFVGFAVYADFSSWAAFGMGVATFVIAQLLYVVWLAEMAKAEARRRTTATRLSDSASTKPKHEGV